jgi:hypothetical protein
MELRVVVIVVIVVACGMVGWWGKLTPPSEKETYLQAGRNHHLEAIQDHIVVSQSGQLQAKSPPLPQVRCVVADLEQ